MINIVDVKALGLVDPLGTPLTADYAPSNNTKMPRYRIHNNKLVLYISNTLINKFFERGESIEKCYREIFETVMTSNYKKPPTQPMIKGSYFETKAIGGGAGGSSVDDLPRIRGGKMSADHKRINEQVVQFKILSEEYGVILSDDSSNVQVKGMKHYPQDHWVDVEVFLTGEADFISPIEFHGHKFPMAIVDLKLTKDLTSTFGKYSWANKQFINTQQGTIYHLLFDLPFLFWVFDYPAKERSNELLYVNHDVNNENQALANKAKYRLREVHETIRKTISEIAGGFINEWPTNPVAALCKKCPVKDCLDRNLLEEL